MDLRLCSDGVLDDLLFREDCEGLVLMSVPSPAFKLSLAFFSLVAAEGVELPNSSDVRGVFGVLPEEPKEAKAPDPRPNAEEAPLVGDATLVVVRGAIPFKGLDLLLKEPSPPKRLAGWYGREFSGLILSLVLLLDFSVESDSLLELWKTKVNKRVSRHVDVSYLERRCHRLSMSRSCGG